MFKVGDIVKYSQKFCGAGEEKYIHKILEINEETGNILIATLNTALTLGCTEVVKAEMIELIENETNEDETMTTYKLHCLEGKYFIHRIMDNCVAGWFIGYDFMGTAEFGNMDPDNGMDKNEAEAIMADLIAAE